MSDQGKALTLCLLPGLDGTGRLYRRLIDELSADFDIRVIDYPNDAFDGYASLAKAVVTQLPVDRRFVLVAESFAGPLSVLVASRCPDGLRGLVIAASFLRRPISNSSTLARVLRYLPPLIQPPLALLEAVLMGGWEDRVVRDELASALRSVSPQVLKSRLLAAMRVDAREEFLQIAVPVLYLRASRDRLLRSGVTHDFTSAANPPQKIEIEAPHFVFQAVAPEAARHIRTFISGKAVSAD